MSIICGATSADLSVAVCSCLQLGPAWQLTAVSQPSASQDCAAQLANEGRNAIFWSIYNVGGLTAVCRCRPLPGGARYDLMCIFPMISGLVSRVAPWFLLLPVRPDITGTGAGAENTHPHLYTLCYSSHSRIKSDTHTAIHTPYTFI